MATIKIDSSKELVVLECLTCRGVWRACAWSPAEAYETAMVHESRVHPGEFNAAAARNQWLRRQRRQAATRR